MIDEYQDTNSLQFEVVTALTTSTTIFAWLVTMIKVFTHLEVRTLQIF